MLGAPALLFCLLWRDFGRLSPVKVIFSASASHTGAALWPALIGYFPVRGDGHSPQYVFMSSLLNSVPISSITGLCFVPLPLWETRTWPGIEASAGHTVCAVRGLPGCVGGEKGEAGQPGRSSPVGSGLLALLGHWST